MSSGARSTPGEDGGIPVGVIGGSGLYDIDDIDIVEERDVETPFGYPSGTIRIGDVDGCSVAFLPRHGEAHQYNPTSVPYRANIWAMKSLGVFWLMGVSAVGSLRESIEPGDFVVPDQIIDKTFRRANTLFEEVAVHVGLSKPYDPPFRDMLLETARETLEEPVHDGSTYVCMEGPAFSTQAESAMHRGWGADLVGMTAMPEARLAREAEMAYATLALPTDYDVWRESTPNVEVEEVMSILEKSTSGAQEVVGRIVPKLADADRTDCAAHGALETAIVTDPSAIPEQTRRKLGILLNEYLD